MWNVITNGHRRPLIYRYELTDGERSAMGYDESASEDETAQYVRYRGDVIPLSDFTTTAPTAWNGADEFRRMGWDGYAVDSYSTATVVRYTDDGSGGEMFGYVVIGRAWQCDCSEDGGACATHSETIAQRVGSSNRSADELCAVFLDDAADALAAAGSAFPTEWDDVRALADNSESWEGSWLRTDLTVPNASEGYSASDALRDAVSAAEHALGAIGLTVEWDDGYVIMRVTGGPLAAQ